MTAAAARNLSLADEVGAHAMERLTETIRGSVRAMLPASDCRTVLLEADDESYMHDRMPWPVVGPWRPSATAPVGEPYGWGDRGASHICNRPTAPVGEPYGWGDSG
jgi:hypothetical protein